MTQKPLNLVQAEGQQAEQFAAQFIAIAGHAISLGQQITGAGGASVAIQLTNALIASMMEMDADATVKLLDASKVLFDRRRSEEERDRHNELHVAAQVQFLRSCALEAADTEGKAAN